MLTVTYEARYACYFYSFVVPSGTFSAPHALRNLLATFDMTAVIDAVPSTWYPRVYPTFTAILPDGEPMAVQITQERSSEARFTDEARFSEVARRVYVIEFRCYQLTPTETVKAVLHRAFAAMQPGLDEWIQRWDSGSDGLVQSALGLDRPPVSVSE